ncbi:MAG TPA: DMT family transporter [Panacibacter sp.]|nr:DMT family transporter [Panacibacter sp.]HNP45878.1 DMT family transporter [Panacibacter sp.]
MNDKKHRESLLVGFIIAFLGSVLFSTKAIIIKKAFADTGVSAVTLLALRMLFSLPFYLVAALISSRHKDNEKFTGKEWLMVSIVGLLGYYVSSLFDFLGLQYVSAGIERLILFFYPTFAIFINAWLFKTKVTRNQKIALALTYTGIAIAYFGELRSAKNNPDFIFGSILVFICAITYSLYIVGSGRLIPRVGASKFTAYAMLSATVGVLTHFFAVSNIAEVQWSADLTAYGLMIAVISTVIPSFLLSIGMRKIGSNNTAIVTSIGPVSTILQAHWILGENIFTEQIVGTILVVGGVFLIGWKAKNKEIVSAD